MFSADMIIQFTYTHTHIYIHTDLCRHEACGFLYLQTHIYIYIFYIHVYQYFIHVVARQCRYTRRSG